MRHQSRSPLDLCITNLANLFTVESSPSLIIELKEEISNITLINKIDKSVTKIALVLEINWKIEKVILSLIISINSLNHQVQVILIGNISNHNCRSTVSLNIIDINVKVFFISLSDFVAADLFIISSRHGNLSSLHFHLLLLLLQVLILEILESIVDKIALDVEELINAHVGIEQVLRICWEVLSSGVVHLVKGIFIPRHIGTAITVAATAMISTLEIHSTKIQRRKALFHLHVLIVLLLFTRSEIIGILLTRLS